MSAKGCNDCLGKFTPCFLIPQRYVMAVMMAFAIFNCYTMRTCMSMAINKMIPSENKTSIVSGSCPGSEEETNTTSAQNSEVYEWTSWDQGIILSSFYWGYIVSHLPGAYFSERFGGKHILGGGMFGSALVTLLFPILTTSTKGNIALVVTLRIVIGLGQGIVFPCINAVLAQWVPDGEKGTVSALTYAGQAIGAIVGNAVSGAIMMATKSWEPVFYVFGSLGICWNIIWQLCCYSYPRSHPCLGEKEREYLEKELEHRVSKKKMKTPWKQILSSLPVWAAIIGQWGHDWGLFTLVTDLPLYMHSVLRFKIESNGLFSGLPWGTMFVSIIAGGYFTDWIIKKRYLSTTNARRVMGTVGCTGPVVFVIIASYVGCDWEAAVAMFTLAMFFMGFYFSGMKVNAIDLAPNFAGTITCLMNGLGVFAGIFAPMVVGKITEDNSGVFEWRAAFWITFGITVVTNVFYVVFVSGEIQPWNNPEDENI